MLSKIHQSVFSDSLLLPQIDVALVSNILSTPNFCNVKKNLILISAMEKNNDLLFKF